MGFYSKIPSYSYSKEKETCLDRSGTFSVDIGLSGAEYGSPLPWVWQAKIEQKVYLSSELKKLEYNVLLAKASQVVTPN